jgi:uncharacterized glyoxalase superfamily protein PhnB
MKLEATLYIKDSVKAVEFYKEAFGAVLGEWYSKFPDGTYMHAPLVRDGNVLFSLCESKNDAFVEMMLKSTLKESRPTMSYGINFDTEEEIKKAYEILSDGGTVLLPLGPLPWSALAADVVDQFGVYWYLTIYSSADS